MIQHITTKTLKPCPKCGSDSVELNSIAYYRTGTFHHIQCNACGYKSASVENKNAAIMVWNNTLPMPF